MRVSVKVEQLENCKSYGELSFSQRVNRRMRDELWCLYCLFT